MKFTKVMMVKNQPVIAKVNRETGVLYLNESIWDQLPLDEKNFVLLHENGHLQLKSADEFEANEYAVKKFVPVGKFSSKKLGKRIMVMADILDKADDGYSQFSPGLIAGALGSIFQTLPVLGIGSKARVNETQAQTTANLQLITAKAQAQQQQSKQLTKLLLLGGVLALVIIVTIKILKK